ncbi:MAG: hypothetical protein Q8N94_04990 [Methanoregula sp.]|nr:hypothetical protein [Methanoregula sp.]
MEEEKQSPEPVRPMQVADPTGNPATPATVKAARSTRKWILTGGIFLLIVIIAAAFLVFGVLRTPNEPIVGTWTVESTGLQMQFDMNGTATLRYPETGYYAIGRWEKVAENRYQLLSAKGTPSPLLSYDPIADALHTDDFSMLLIKKG